MSEVQKQNRILEFVSQTDPLTGLMNRRGLMEKLLEAAPQRNGQTACMLFADLDHLKQINDTYGHAEGDCALKQIGSILTDLGEKESLVARIGGDEFIVVIFEREKREYLVRQIREKCAAYNASSEKPYLVECSVGIVEFICEPDMDVAKLLESADQVMYAAKQNRRKTVLR
ncbi:MAG: GGDEF domain-containing protein [Clostridiales bacterium]|nr:GGDEF domain-containing protein [Clostridiales bacterium]